MSAALDLVVDAIACYRCTKLVTDDVITEPLRRGVVCGAFQLAGLPTAPMEDEAVPVADLLTEWEETADRPTPKLATLVTCRWCAGLWCALGVVAASRVAPRAWRPLARALTLSAAAALLANLEDE